MADSQLLKKDLFGEFGQIGTGDTLRTVRDSTPSSTWTPWLVRRRLAWEDPEAAADRGDRR